MEPSLSCLNDSLFAQRPTESDYSNQGEGISAQHSRLKPGACLHEVYCIDSEYGEDVYDVHSNSAYESGNYVTIAGKHRPRRSAAARRLQHKRSDARAVCRLLAGLSDIDAHRGDELSLVGKNLRCLLLERNENKPRDPPDFLGGVAHGHYNRPTCRHWLRRRCTYGASCRFSHDVDAYDNGDTEHSVQEESDDHHSNDGTNGNESGHESTADHRKYGNTNDDTAASYVSDGLARGEVQDGGTACEHRPEFYHVAACKSTRYMLALFSAAAEDFLADYESADTHDHNVEAADTDYEDVQDIITILKALPLPDAATHFNNLPTYLQDEV